MEIGLGSVLEVACSTFTGRRHGLLSKSSPRNWSRSANPIRIRTAINRGIKNVVNNSSIYFY
jgi:hypothetical protein